MRIFQFFVKRNKNDPNFPILLQIIQTNGKNIGQMVEMSLPDFQDLLGIGPGMLVEGTKQANELERNFKLFDLI